MNKIFIIILSAVLFSACSTAYKTGQTPDDVYFSPSLNRSEYVVMEEEDGYRAEDIPMDDRYLRMKSMRRNRWSAFDDDYMYWNDPRWNSMSYFNTFPGYDRMGMGMGMNSFYNPYYMNPFSNMYYGQPYVIYNINNYNTKMLYSRPRSTGPRMANMNLPTPVRVSNYNPKMLEFDSRSGRSYISSGGSTPRGGYNPVNTSSVNGSPARTFNSSNNSSNSGSRFSSGSSSSGSSNGSSSGSSGSAPVRSFPRGGGGL
jgi:hypothetical protein